MRKHNAWKPLHFSLAFNLVFGAYNIILGAAIRSWWMLTVGTYYVVLGIMRFSIYRTKRGLRILQRFTGMMLICMAIPLVGTVILAYAKDRGMVLHEVVMITMAVCAFTKITVATIKLAKSHKSKSKKTKLLRSISFADASVSILSLQRSMLVSFEGMTETGIRIMNIATGSGVSILVFSLGVNLLYKSSVRPQSRTRSTAEKRC